jgi:DNA-binding transcriptional LysR family regulator
VELRQLRYFVAVAEEHHFGRAASRLRIATPSLSQQIRALERDLHVLLLDRDSHGLALTPAGTALLQHARALLARAQRARDDVRAAERHRQPLSVRVTIGAERILAELLRGLPARAPQLEVSVATTLGADAIHAVRDDRADAAVVWVGGDAAEHLTTATLRDVPLYLVLPARHRLAAARVIPVAELAGETVILFPRHLAPAVWDRIVGHLHPGRQPGSAGVLAEADQLGGPDALLSAVAKGSGVAVTAAPVGGRPVDGIVVRPLDPPLTLSLQLVWREPAGAALRELVSLLTGDREKEPGGGTMSA